MFTARFPLLHMRIEWRELIQGLVVSLSSGLALVPLLTMAFGLTFEEAIAISMIHIILNTSSVVIFGEPYASGWIAPAFPFALAFVLSGGDSPVERFQLMTALTLDFTLIVLFLGLTGLGATMVRRIPNGLKAGIIFGAALSAFKRVFYDDIESFTAMPTAMTLALLSTLIIAFYGPFQKWRQHNKVVDFIASFGLLPSFILAGVFGSLLGEFNFDIQMGFLIPPFTELFAKVSPFAIGFPSIEYFLAALPLAFVSYLLLFGDLLTGTALIESAQKHRPDDPIKFNLSRSHYSVAIRNALSAVIAPFFPTQGILWAGGQVIILERWKQGKEAIESLFSGISAFYYYGIPVAVMFLPIVTFLKPFMPIALMLALAMTAVACAKLSFQIALTKKDRLIMAVTAIILTYFWG